MRLTLSTLRCPDGVAPEVRTLAGGEFSLGRAPDNAWVLADPRRHLSKRHCVVALRDGLWQVADTSTNGTFLNDEADPIGRGGARMLRDGDRIRLGAYVLEARMSAEERVRSPAQRRAGNPFDDSSLGPLPAPPAAALAGAPPHAPPKGGDAAAVAAFLRGAGLPDARIEDPVATMEALGAAMRAMVGGLRAALIARAATKARYRIEQTMIRARGNNPLKFSADDDDALAALLGAGRRAAMPPQEAVTAALRDLERHERAAAEATQVAVRAVLADLSPQALLASVGTAPRPVERKSRAFDALEERHAALLRSLSDEFDSVFGRAFGRAYEEALRRLPEADPE
jgi:predicted component of type VI protein secretion system